VSHVHSYIEIRLCLDGHAGGMFTDLSLQTSLPTNQITSRYQQCTHTFVLMLKREYMQHILSIKKIQDISQRSVKLSKMADKSEVLMCRSNVVTVPSINIRC